ncbi:MAG: hypothetical protein JWN08_1931 [Frankiales bacterium]|nr:hypothetical protein [Frankiales bacterium]
MTVHLPVPSWVVRLVLFGLAGVLLLLLVGLALLLPYVPRLAAAGVALPEAVALVKQAPGTLDQVERIDRNVDTVVPPVLAATEQLSAVTPELAALVAQVEAMLVELEQLENAVGPVADVGPRVADLSSRLTALQATLLSLDTRLGDLETGLATSLGDVEDPLRRLADTTGPLPASLDRLQQGTASLEQLPVWFAQLQRVLEDVALHVENLDRKTGPPPPALP